MPGREHQVAMLDQLYRSWTTLAASSLPLSLLPSSSPGGGPARSSRGAAVVGWSLLAGEGLRCAMLASC